VAEAPVTNFCCFGVPRELHNDQGHNFEYCLMQEVLELQRVSKTQHTPALAIGRTDGMVKRYIRTVEERLRKVIASHQRDWDARLRVFLIAYRTSTHDTTGLTSASLVFGRDFRLPCDLLFGAPPDEGRPTIEHVASGPFTRHPRICPPTSKAGQ
jgi:hypothetical protein